MLPDDITPTAAPTPLPFPRLYRAHVTAADTYGVERTAFVEAASHRAAARKIANVVAAIENRLPDQVEERIYNVYSSSELIEEGLSEDIELRLFETGWCGGKAAYFVEQPLFLISAPALIRKWGRIVELPASLGSKCEELAHE